MGGGSPTVLPDSYLNHNCNNTLWSKFSKKLTVAIRNRYKHSCLQMYVVTL